MVVPKLGQKGMCMKGMLLAGAALSAWSGSASAMESVQAKVITVEASYMPNTVSFSLDAGTATCPAGVWLLWQKGADSNKAAYALLLTALTTGKTITFYHQAGSCVGEFLHISR